MFHEQLKEKIIFGLGTTKGILVESPVLMSALGGVIVTYLLWTHFSDKSRLFLFLAALFGTASVALDVMSLSLLGEEFFKLVGELCITCALLFKVDKN